MTPRAAPAWQRHDLWGTLAALALILAWDASGWDGVVTRAFGGPGGFPWRSAWLTQAVLHDGARRLAWVLLGGLAWRAWRPPAGDALGSPARRRALLAMLIAVVAVPAIKQWSRTSCPAELTAFGGTAQWVDHWAWGVSDGGPGRCFPSGHAVAAFAFLPMALAWRGVSSTAHRWWWIGIGLPGLALGGTQVLRGEHFVSHVLWSAWLCWTLSAGLHHLAAALGGRTAPAGRASVAIEAQGGAAAPEGSPAAQPPTRRPGGP